jgi:hypothetical protein
VDNDDDDNDGDNNARITITRSLARPRKHACTTVMTRTRENA